jgi:hypothetical protein
METMIVLGLSRGACVTALEQYLARFRELVAAAERDASSGGTGNADALLDRLLFQLEVDAQSRTGPGRERMSSIELDVFAPVVEDLSARLSRLTARQPPKSWVPVLVGCQATVLAVLERLA